MKKENSSTSLLRLLLPMFLVVLLGTGPCYCGGMSDQCPDNTAAWCEDGVAYTCHRTEHPAGGSDGNRLESELCSSKCALVDGESYQGDDRKIAVCLDLIPCTTPGEEQCIFAGEGWNLGERMKARCVEVSTTTWFGEFEIDGGLDGLEYVYEPTVQSNSYPLVDGRAEPCIECASSCGCPGGSVCTEGYCFDGDEGEEDLFCCDPKDTGSASQRVTLCPDGEACEKFDGSAGVCETTGRCEPCQNSNECSEGKCQRVSSDRSVCLPLAEEWGEPECREGENQIWQPAPCGDWSSLIEDCGEGSVCEDAECVPIIPEIEVSPTLLDYGPTTLHEPASLSVNIGNLGRRTLVVDTIELEGDDAALFQVDPATAEVAVDTIIQIVVTFTPQEVGPVSARLIIHSDDEDEPEITVLINGEGVQ